MPVKYYYELTGRKGETLFDSLSEYEFDRLILNEAEHIEKQSASGGEMREAFVDHLYDKLNDDGEIDDLKEEVSELADADEDAIKKWLLSNECPVVDEKTQIQEWALKEANWNASEGFSWDDDDRKDDVCAALTFGLIKYPEELREKLDAITTRAREISAKASSEAKGEDEEGVLEELITKVEHEELSKLIKVSGFYCEIHGGRSKYKEAISRNKVLTCPSCGHPVCPVCANMFSKNPSTEDDAKEFLKSCDDVSGHAYCGECGDYSEEFMLRFLKLVGCPIPEEFLGKEHTPRPARYMATCAVDALPDKDSILEKVRSQFEGGASGIIKIEHPTGMIWGKPERHPEGWVVTLLYPHEY